MFQDLRAVATNGDVHRSLRLKQPALDVRRTLQTRQNIDLTPTGVEPNLKSVAIVQQHTTFAAFTKRWFLLCLIRSQHIEDFSGLVYWVSRCTVYVDVDAVARFFRAFRFVKT